MKNQKDYQMLKELVRDNTTKDEKSDSYLLEIQVMRLSLSMKTSEDAEKTYRHLIKQINILRKQGVSKKKIYGMIGLANSACLYTRQTGRFWENLEKGIVDQFLEENETLRECLGHIVDEEKRQMYGNESLINK